ncbi:ubiquitin-like protein [Teratosphaeria nubilosa]|uniref:Ubiquitin-like protein n=1 Tax=Teratosphaeria nubilosa TaxID=161662 RepID=A0A6G1KZ00_9PEZI|nr:ubiquitin-like protein [Teratosphaeria nubilosa]
MADHQKPAVNEVAGDGNETPQQAPQSFNITFKDSNGYEVSFKMKATTKMGKAISAFAQRTEKKKESLRFIFDGDRVLDETTPGDLSLEDGDIIEVYQEQLGGFV